MGFFHIPDPTDDDDTLLDDDEDEFDPPTAQWIGGVVPVEVVVARSDQAAVVVRSLVAYPDGFAFTLDAFLHRSVKLKRDRRGPFHHHDPWGDDGPIGDETLRFGISWPDGGRATNLDRWGRGWEDATEPAHGLESGSSGGGGREYSWEYWAWPLPVEGELRFICEWPGFKIPETAAAVAGGALIDAARRAFPVWPDDADRASHMTRGGMFRSVRAHQIRTMGSPGDEGPALEP